MKKIISIILVAVMITAIGVEAFGIGVNRDEYFKTMIGMYVDAFEEDNEERGTDYDIEVEYLEEGADIVIYCDGDEGVESITVCLNEYAQCTMFIVLYSDGTTQYIPD